MSDVVSAAQGKWPAILPAMGVEAKYLRNVHGPCPKCGGKDRFRFDDVEGKGTWICSRCGAGDGFGLLRLVKGLEFREVAREVERLAGEAPRGKINGKPAADPSTIRAMLREARAVEAGDVVDRYLRGRGIALSSWPGLRLLWREPWPIMLGLVTDGAGKLATLHRTWLRPDGAGKAPLTPPRKLMPGTTPRSSAIRLGPMAEHIGVAEGIETALRAGQRHGLPVWALISTASMARWEPPAGVRRVTVFGDRDRNYAGQAAAYTLAHRLATDKVNRIDVDMAFPPWWGDWADQEVPA